MPARATSRRPAPPLPDELSGRQLARRERVVGAAIDLMLLRDYGEVQMKDAAAAGDVALGTMYRYFMSKDHLFAEALLRWSEGFPAEAAMPRSVRAVDRLKIAFRRAVRAFERYPSVHSYILALQMTTDPVAADIYARWSRLQNGAWATYLSKVPPGRRDDIVDVMGAVLDTNLRDWLLGKQPISAVYSKLDRTADLLLR